MKKLLYWSLFVLVGLTLILFAIPYGFRLLMIYILNYDAGFQ